MVYRRRHKIYDLVWRNVHLDKFRVVGAPYGGPLVPLSAYFYLMDMLHLFAVAVQGDGIRVVAMHWNSQEQLVCVLHDGSVRIYNLDGEYKQFSLGQVAKDHSVIDCKFWGEGLVALTGNYKLVAVNNMQEPRPRILADSSLSSPPCSWAVIPPRMTLSGHVEVYVATQSTIWIIDSREAQDQ
ncbi:Vacuolar protein, partial [Tieghemiomyces parasiticus]